ncbi:facilitated trehalose transporter Tret1-2 homolog [Coccinella septempunctata]|uniref:facilitated trehalose transporter Tret1-2 homolog n=1 Tax=Coccinella septempunctata TaxID=41139 RepID=UPI001D08E464|nr:facilitated trehalose transporter Tret1-2 homolog [Coccinella septempunctata]
MIRTVNFKLVGAACSVNLLAFATGNAYAWSSTVLTTLKSNQTGENPLGRPITSFEESWIASLISLGAACGPSLAGFCADKFGRKKTLLTFAIPMLISHIMLSYASTPAEFYIARFILGLGVGSVFTIVPMYIGEIAETETRGFLGCIMGIFLSCGLLFVYSIGPFVNLTNLSIILTLPIILFMITFGIFFPESPYYFVAKNDELAAEISLNKLRNNESSNLKELSEIKQVVAESKAGSTSMLSAFKGRSFRKGITITVMLMVFQQFVGITIILSYMEKIFIASGSTISSTTSTMIVALIQWLMVILSSFLVDRWGRRLLLILASAGCALPLFSLGFYFYLKDKGNDVSSMWWLPILSLVIYIISYNFGLGTLPWALVGELFSTKTKSLASTITATTCLALAFTMTLIFPKMEEIMGLSGAFWFFGGSALKSFVFVLWYVPETKGRTFQEILMILEK